MKKESAGAPTKYKKDYPRQAGLLCREHGFTIPKLAKLFDVHRDTIYEWMNTYDEFSDAINKGRDEYDSAEIETSAKKRAKGYTYQEVTKELVSRENPETGEEESELVIKKVVTKEVPPDPASFIWWLSVRNPERWPNPKHLQQNTAQPVIINANFGGKDD